VAQEARPVGVPGAKGGATVTTRNVSAKTVMAQIAWEREQAKLPGVFIPLKTVSEANQRGRWFKGHKRAKDQRCVVGLTMRGRRPQMPCTVTLTRYGPRLLDPFDNLPRALKAVADGVCDAFGVDDKLGSGLTFKAEQEQARFYGVRIVVEPKETR
jgi:hypothetical protein